MAEHEESGLLSQLGRAQRKISSLEEFLRDREKQFHSAVSRLRTERRDSRGFRPRRVGRGNDALLRMHTLCQSQDEPEDDPDLLSQPLGEYVCLRLARIVESGDEDDPVPFVLRRLVSRQYHVGPEGAVIGSASDCSVCLPKEAGVSPQQLEIKWIAKNAPQGGREIPREGRRGSRLTRQSAVEDSGFFQLEDLTGGGAVFSLTPGSPTLLQTAILEQQGSQEGGRVSKEGRASEEGGGTFSILSPRSSIESQVDQSNEGTVSEKGFQPAVTVVVDGPDQSDHSIQTQAAQSDAPTLSPLPLSHGVKFQTGCVEWSLTALPRERVLTLKMFAAVQRGDLAELRAVLTSGSRANLTIPYVFVSTDDASLECPPEPTRFRYCSVSVPSEQELDVNVEYQAPSYGDDSYYNQVFSQRRASAHVPHPLSPLSPLSPTPSDPHPPCLLLHIAVCNGDVEMVRFLMEKGADVNRCSGDLQQTALHLAAQLNLLPVTTELLHWGADVELADAQHLQPLALTTSYQIRRLLLSSALLCSAAEAGDSEEVVRLLSSLPLSPNARSLRHKNSLHLACARGHEGVVQTLLLKGADVNAKGGSRQRTPLHYASLNNHVAIATVLLQAGANEFARDSGGYTPLNLSMGGEMCKLLHKQPLSLCLAVQSSDLAAVKDLLRDSEHMLEGDGTGVRAVDQRNEQGHAPLHLAATTGNLEVVRELVSHGAELNLHGGSDRWTPICYAAMAGHEEIVEFLLSVGADTEECDSHGNTVQERVEQAMDEIKDRRAYLEKRGRSESIVETSLHTLEPASMVRQESAPSSSVEGELSWLRLRYDRLKAVSRLLTSVPERLLKAMETRNLSDFTSLLGSEGVSPEVMVDKHCPTPVLIRACEDGLYHFTEALLEYGAKVYDSGPQDHMPLLVAAGNGHSDIVQLLLKHGANCNAQSSDGLTSALHEAASANSLPTVQCLLAAGADVTAQNSAGETPFDSTTLMEIRQLLAFGPNRLLLAASNGDHTTIRQLVEDGVSHSHEFPRGITALHEACEGGHEEAVKVLIDLGADVNKQAHVTLATPLHLASYHAHPAIARLLLGAGSRLDTKDSEGKVPFEVAATNELRRILVEARSLRAEPVSYERQRSSGQRCMICMDNPINTILLPCGHQAFCTGCVSQITTCALDRQPIREVITVFK